MRNIKKKNNLLRFIRKSKKPLQRVLAIILNIAMLFTMSSVDQLGVVFAASDPVDFTINGKTAVDGKFTVVYGENIEIKDANNKGPSDTAYKINDGKNTKDQANVTEGLPKDPGEYYLFVIFTGSPICVDLSISKDKFQAPTNLSWGLNYNYNLNWNKQDKTNANLDYPADAFKEYIIKVYKADSTGKFVQVRENISVTDQATISYNASAWIDAYGKYKFTVQAISNKPELYDNSDIAESSEYWIRDNINPVIYADEFKFEYNSSGVPVLSAKVIDNESGIYGYAFSKNSGTPAHDDGSQWITPQQGDETAGVDHTFTQTVTAPGSYRFYAKDKDNVFGLSKTINIAKVTYIDYYNGGNDTYKAEFEKYHQTTDDKTLLLTPARKGYDFDGWYTTRTENASGGYDYSGKIESLDADSTAEITVYAKWVKSNITASIVEGDDSTGIITEAGMTYSGNGQIKASVEKPEGIELTYQWYKYNSNSIAENDDDRFETIPGATSSVLDVKNVVDNGTYKVKIIWDDKAEDGYKFSSPVTVKINKKSLQLTPHLAEGKSVYYADDKPAAADFTFTIDEGDLVDADKTEDNRAAIIAEIKATEGSYSTTYTKGNDAGIYNITASGFSASNYELDFKNGSFTVQPKAISDEDNNNVSILLTQEDGKSQDTYSYKGAGSFVNPEVTLTDSSLTESVSETPKTLTSGSDYAVAYSNNTNVTDNALVTITFKGNYSGTLTKKFKISKATYESAVSLSGQVFDVDGKYMYDGETHEAAFSVSKNPEGGKVTYYYKEIVTEKNSEGVDEVKEKDFDGIEGEKVPKHAGKYQVYAKIAATANYEEVTTEPTTFEITKRPIRIESESKTWEYSDTTYSAPDILDSKVTGLAGVPVFAPGEDFKYKRAITEIKDKGTAQNKIEYEFAVGTHARDYEVTEVYGTLEVTEQQLKTPSNQIWDIKASKDTDKLAVASWIGVTKDSVEIKYELQLYRLDGSTPKAVGGPVENLTETSYSFYNVIKEDLKTNGVPDGGYFYTVKSLSAGGSKKDNYLSSEPTPIYVKKDGVDVINPELARLYATKLSISIDSATVDGAYFVVGDGTTSNPQYLIQGEHISLVTTLKPGYDAKYIYDTEGDGLFLVNSYTNGDCEYHISTLSKPSAETIIKPKCYDKHPKMAYFSSDVDANNENNKQSVILKFKASDELGITHVRVGSNESWTENNIGDSKENAFEPALGEHTITVGGIEYTYTYSQINGEYVIEGTAKVFDSGAYNFTVWDASNNYTYYAKKEKVTEEVDVRDPETGLVTKVTQITERTLLNPINVYKVTFNAGSVTKDGVKHPANKTSGYPEYILKLTGQRITIPDITGKIYANGFVFTNFRGDTGIYTNNGVYTANKNDTLTAHWSDETYRYTVNYWYQDIDETKNKAKVDADGNPVYTRDEDASVVFTARYGQSIYPALSEIQKTRNGFIRDDSSDADNTFTVETDGNVVNIYYKRAAYKITYKYTDIDGSVKTFSYTYKDENDDDQTFNGEEYHNFGEAVEQITKKPERDGYTFIGWTYGDSGKAPETMPENNITATGKFEANVTKYFIDYYYQNIDNDDYDLNHFEEKYTYTDGKKDGEGEDADFIYYSARHNTVIDLTKMSAPVIEGFTYNKTAVTNGASRNICPDSSATSGTVSALEDNELHIAYYYTRNKYSITLNVYKGSRLGAESKIYTKTFKDIKFETPLKDVTKDNLYYAKYFLTDDSFPRDTIGWNASEKTFEGFYLTNILDWSTGDAPEQMPASDISISRDYVSTAISPYNVEIYYEKNPGQEFVPLFADSTGKVTPLVYYENSGKTLKAGKTGDPGVTLDTTTYNMTYRTLLFYEFDPDHAGSVISGTVKECVNDTDEPLTLKLYFKRPRVKSTITYQYYDGTTSKNFASVEKWGDWWTKYDIQSDVFTQSGLKVDSDGVLRKDGNAVEFTQPENETVNPFKSLNVYVDKTTGKFVTAETSDEDKMLVEEYIGFAGTGHLSDIRVSTRYMNEAGTDYSYSVDKDSKVNGIYSSRFGATASISGSSYTNYSTVYYVSEGEAASYVVMDVNYSTSKRTGDYGLKRPEDITDSRFDGANTTNGAPCTVTLGGQKYKVRLCSPDMVAIESGDTWTPREGYSNANLSLTGTNYSKFYNDKFLPYITTGDEKYLYIAIPKKTARGAENEFLHDLRIGGYYSINTYTLLHGAKISYNGSEPVNIMGDYDACKQEYIRIQQEKKDNNVEDSARDTTYGSVTDYTNSYNDSYTIISNGADGISDNVIHSYTIYYYKSPAKVVYSLSGTLTKEYSYLETINVGGEGIDDHFGSRPGCEIVWYTDETTSTPAANTYTIPDNKEYTYFYGRYEKTVNKGHYNIYYEIPVGAVEDTEKVYLTAEEIEELISDGISGFSKSTDSYTDTVETEFKKTDGTAYTKTEQINITTYKYKNDIILISKETLQLSNNEVRELEYKLGQYDVDGFAYDSAAVNQVRGYCQDSPIDLSVHFKRDHYKITWDFNDKHDGHKRTDDIEMSVGFATDLNFLAGTLNPVRPGYSFRGWQLKYSDGGEIGELTSESTMPKHDIIAVAQWDVDYFDYEVLHYFQKNDQTYETDVVQALAKKASSAGTEAKFIFSNQTEKDRKAVVYTEGGKSYAAFTTYSGEVLYFTGTYNSESGEFKASISDLIGMKTLAKKDDTVESKRLLSNEDYACNNFAYSKTETFDGLVSNLGVFKYAFTVYRVGADIRNLHPDDTYTADVDMELGLYYERDNNIVVSVAARVTDDPYSTEETNASPKATGITTIGDGNYNYGTQATLTVHLAAGYSFVGWYTVADYNGHVRDQDFETKATKYSDQQSITITNTESQTFVAVSKPDTVQKPANDVENNIGKLIYGYTPTSATVITMKVNLDEDTSGNAISKNSVYHVKGYQWYECDADGNRGAPIEGATSATFNFPAGKDSGKYYYGCEVEVERLDNGRSTKIYAFTNEKDDSEKDPETGDVITPGVDTNNPVTVTASSMVITASGESLVYDGKKHDGQITIDREIGSPAHIKVYFSKVKLTEENYATDGIEYGGAGHVVGASDKVFSPIDAKSDDGEGLYFDSVLTKTYTDSDGKTVTKVSVESDETYTPQRIYYYVVDDSAAYGLPVNFKNTAGSIPIIIAPKTVTIKPLTASFKKVYDGTTALTEKDKERFRNPGDYFEIIGLLDEDKENLTAKFEGEYNNAHVKDAKSITVNVSAIETVTEPAVNYNYKVASSSLVVNFSGEVVARPIDVKWVYSLEKPDESMKTAEDGTKYFEYQYNGKNQAPVPVITGHCENAEDDKNERGVLSADNKKNSSEKDIVSVSASGAQKNCSSYTAQGEINVINADSELHSVNADYKVADEQLKCPFKIIVSGLKMELEAEEVYYDKTEHTLSKLTKDALWSLGVINDKDVADESIEYSLLNGVYTVKGDTGVKVSYQVNKKYVAANESGYDVQIVQGTVKVMSAPDSEAGIESKNITGNFSFEYPASKLTIKKKKVTVEGITADNKEYDATTDATLVFTGVTFPQIISGDTLSLDTTKVTGTFDDKNVGNGKTVNITIGADALTGASANNYELIVDSSVKVENKQTKVTTTANITPATLTVSPYGFSLIKNYIYGEALPDAFTDTSALSSNYIQITASGYKGGEDRAKAVSAAEDSKVTFVIKKGDNEISVENFKYKDAGDYTITLKSTSTADGKKIVDGMKSVDNNYIFVLGDTDTFTVNKRPVAITSTATKTKVYDGTTDAIGKVSSAFAAGDFGLGEVSGKTESGVVNSDEVSVSISGSSFAAAYTDKNVGDANKTIAVSGLTLTGAKSSNYELVSGDINLTGCSITPATLTITANDITDVPYGTNPLTVTSGAYKGSVSYSGFVSGESESNVTFTGTLAYKSTVGSNLEFDANDPAKRKVNTSGQYYDITPGGLSTPNYTINYVSGKFNVVPKEVTITAKNFNLGYKTFTVEQLKRNYEVTTSGWVYDEDSNYEADTKNAAVAKMHTVVETDVDSPAGDYDLYIGKSGTTEADELKLALHTRYPNYKFKLVNGKFTIGRRLLKVDNSRYKVNGRIYDSTVAVRDGQIVLDSATINQLFMTVVGGSDIELPDSTFLTDYFSRYSGKDLVTNLKNLGLTITAEYANKDVKTGETVTLTFTLDPTKYLGLRYYFDQNADGTYVYTKTFTKTADITQKELHIKAKDIDKQVYGSALPAVVVDEVKVSENPNYSDSTHKHYQNVDYDYKFAGSEDFTDLGGTLAISSNYNASNTATVAGATGIIRTPSGYTSNNYNIVFENGSVTVVQAQLATPEDVLWSSDNPGTLTWKRVADIGDVEVGGYKIILEKKTEGGTTVMDVTGSAAETVDDKTVSVLKVTGKDTLSHDFKDDISGQEEPVAIYTVKIWAYPADEKNTAAYGATDSDGTSVTTNVKESEKTDTSTIVTSPAGKLAVATVEPVWASDSDTTNAQNILKIKKKDEDDTKYADKVTLIAGEKAVIRVVPKETKKVSDETVKVWTGYTVADSNFTPNTDNNETTSDWSVSSGDNTQDCTESGKGKFETTFTLTVGTDKTSLKPVVSLSPRPATIQCTMETKDKITNPETKLHVGYGFAQADGPYVTVDPKHNDTDTIIGDGYTYTYKWTIRQNFTSGIIEARLSTGAISSDKKKAILPAEVDGVKSKTGEYIYTCEITATRKDNGKSATWQDSSAKMYIDHSKINLEAKINGWEYGEERETPYLSTDHPEKVTPDYQYNITSAQDDANWTTTKPVNVGNYYIRAYFEQSDNYAEAYTEPQQFAITQATLGNPIAQPWSESTSAPYGLASWDANTATDTLDPVDSIKENNGAAGNTDATVNPVYEVILYKQGVGESTVVATKYVSNATLSCDFTSDIDASGEGKYYYTVQAKPASYASATTVAADSENNRKNVIDSEIKQSDTISIKRLTSSAGEWTKTYDGTYDGHYVAATETQPSTTTQGITVLAKAGEDSYEWYKNGSMITTATEYTTYDVPVFEYKSDADKYSCVSTASDETKTYYITETVTINKRNVTFTADSDTKAYDGTALTKNSYSSVGLAHGDSVDANTITVQNTGDTAVESRINVGSSDNVPSGFTVKRTVGGTQKDMSENYIISYLKGTLTITPRPITTQSEGNNVFTIADISSRTYNATEYKPEPTVTDTEKNVILVKDTDFEYSYSNNIDAGVNTAVLTVTGKGNYSGTLTKNYTITKRPVKFVGDSDTKVYNKTEQSVTGFTTRMPVGAAEGGLVNDETNVHTAQAEYKAARTEVGTTTGAFNTSKFKITASDNTDVTANYEITNTPGTMTITVTDEAMSVSLANESFMYDATAKSLTGTPVVKGIGDAVPEGTTTIEYKFSDEETWKTDLTSLTKIGAGTYTINVRATNPNYSNPAETTATLTINARPVLIKAISEGKAYTGADITINGIEAVKPSTAAVGGLVSGHTHTAEFSATGVEVGEYTGTITAVADIRIKDALGADVTANYAITTENGKLTINATTRDWFVYLIDSIFTYDATNKSLTGTPTVTDSNGNEVKGLTAFTYRFKNTVEYVSSLASLVQKNVGEYLIEVRGINPNFTNNAKKSTTEDIFYAKLIINKATPTVTVDYNPEGALATGSREYNASAVSESDFTIVYSPDLVAEATGKGQKVVEWYSIDGGVETKLDAAPVNAGTYRIKVAYTEGDNYNVSNVAYKDFTIAKKTTADDYYKVTTDNYEGFYDGAYHTGSVTYKPDAATIKFGHTAAQAAGTDPANAALSELPTFKDVKLEADGKYNNGKYTVYYQAVDPNYETPITGSLTVWIKPVDTVWTVSLVDETYVYDGTAKNMIGTPTVAGPNNTAIDGVTVYSYKLAGESDSAYVTDLSSLKKTEIGEYVIDVKAENEFYAQDAFTTAKLIIKPIERNWYVSLADDTFTYDATAHFITGAPSVVEADGSAVIGTTSYSYRFKNDAAYVTDLSLLTKVDYGTYEIEVKAENPNYTNPAKKSATANTCYAKLIINKAEPTADIEYNVSGQITGGTKVYDAKAVTEDDFIITYSADSVANATGKGTIEVKWFKVNGNNEKAIAANPYEVGDYRLKVQYTEGDNFKATAAATKDFSITKRPVEFVGDSDTKIYNKTEQSVTGFTTRKPDGVAEGGLVNDSTNVHTASAKYKAARTEVGTTTGAFNENKFKITAADDADVTANYEITNTPGTITITPTTAEMTVSLAGENYMYDGNVKRLTGTPVVKGIGDVVPEGITTFEYKFSDEDTWTTDLSALTKIGAGTYTINVRATNPNYTKPAESTAKLTINARPVLIRAISEGKAYTGADITISGTEAVKPGNAAVGGLVSGHTHTAQFNATGTDVGVYTGTISAPDEVVIKDMFGNDVTANYIITTENGTLTINASTRDWFVYLADSIHTYDATNKFITGQPTVIDSNGNVVSGTTTFAFRFKNTVDYVTGLAALVQKNVGEYLVEVMAINPNFVNPAKSESTKNSFIAKLIINKATPAVAVSHNPAGALATGSREYNTRPVSVDNFTIRYTADEIANATGKGAREYEWYSVNDGVEKKLESAPVVAGNYRIKARYTAGSNFNATEWASCDFAIDKKTTSDGYYKVTTTDYDELHDAKYHTGTISIPKNATVRFGTTEEQAAGGSALDKLPEYEAIGEHIIYYYVTDPDYATPITGTILVRIRKNSYEVKYEPNALYEGITIGSMPEVNPDKKIQTDDLILSDAVPTAKDANGVVRYVFTGWNTKADGTGTAYKPADVYKLDAPVTLYAQWMEKISGNVTFDYNYIDPEDKKTKTSDQQISEAEVALFKNVDGVKTEIDRKVVKIKSKGKNGISAENPYEFDDQPTFENGKPVTYTVELESTKKHDLSNYSKTADGYKDRDLTAKYNPGTFILQWVINVDTRTLSGEEIRFLPDALNIRVLYRESADGSDEFRPITQHNDSYVVCKLDRENMRYAGEYPVWKWNSTTNTSYYHNFEIVSVSKDGVISSLDERNYEFIKKSFDLEDETVVPVHFVPADMSAPLAAGKAAGGVDDKGVMTGLFYGIPEDEEEEDYPSIYDKPVNPTPTPGITPGTGTKPTVTPGNTPSDKNPTNPDKKQDKDTDKDKDKDSSKDKDKHIELIPSKKDEKPGDDSLIPGNVTPDNNTPGNDTPDRIIEGTIDLDDDEMIDLLTEPEKERYDDGEKVKVRLEVEKIPEDDNDHKKAKDKIKLKLPKGEELKLIFDVDLYIQVGEEPERKVDPSEDKHNVKIKLPDDINDLPDEIKKTIKIYRIITSETGEDIIEIIDCKLLDDGTVEFNADTTALYGVTLGTGTLGRFRRSYFILFNFIAMLLMIIISIIRLFGKANKYEDDDEDEDENQEKKEQQHSEEYLDDVEKEEKKRRRNKRLRKLLCVLITIISLIIYIIYFTWGKIIWFDKLSWYFAIALLLVVILALFGRRDKDVDEEEEQEDEDLTYIK